jgi:glutaredoxin
MTQRIYILLAILAVFYFLTMRDCFGKSEPTREFFNTSKKLKCTLYTSSGCQHCKNMKGQWDQFINDPDIVNSANIIVENKEDDQIDDPNVQFVPQLKITVLNDCNCGDANNANNANNEKHHYYQGEMKAEAFKQYLQTI